MILNEARETVLHAADILGEALPELVVDAFVLDGPVEIGRQTERQLNNVAAFHLTPTSMKTRISIPLPIELRLAAVILVGRFGRFPSAVSLVRHHVTVIVALAPILLELRTRERQVGLGDVQLFHRGLVTKHKTKQSETFHRPQITEPRYMKHGLLFVVELLQLLARLAPLGRLLFHGLDVLQLFGHVFRPEVGRHPFVIDRQGAAFLLGIE